ASLPAAPDSPPSGRDGRLQLSDPDREGARMSFVTGNQPAAPPTWIAPAVPNLERAMAFYGALFGWEFEVGPPETMRYTQCRLGGRRGAALADNPHPEGTRCWWSVCLATRESC